MAIMRVSRIGSVLVLCLAALLPACATATPDEEIRTLEARASYEAGVKSISEGRISLGLSSLRQAVEIEPRNSLYHNAVGAVLLNIGRHADAQAEFQKAVELDPTYADAYHNLAILFNRLSNFSRIMNVEQIAVTALPIQTEKTITADFIAKTFMYVEPKEPEPASKKKKAGAATGAEE